MNAANRPQPNTFDGHDSQAKNQDHRTGHKALKLGTIIFLVSFAISFSSQVLGDSTPIVVLSLLFILATVVGFVIWLVGLVQRIRFNKSATAPLSFTLGEKIALLGSIFMAFGLVVVNGNVDSDGMSLGRVLAIAGLVASAGGAVWHLLTPRKR